MFSLSRHNFLKFAAAGGLVALTAASSTPVSADEIVQSVGPRQFMINTVGSKRVTAFFAPSNGTCNLYAVILNNNNDADDATVVRVQLSLNPAQTVSIDSVENKSLALKCGDYADVLSVVDTNQKVVSE